MIRSGCCCVVQDVSAAHFDLPYVLFYLVEPATSSSTNNNSQWPPTFSFYFCKGSTQHTVNYALSKTVFSNGFRCIISLHTAITESKAPWNDLFDS